ncbi:UDP-glucuronic acid decarboxylase family protein [Fictibacillus sp. KU28468]|uniref:UDP-glucuronic acid decarboxylase family protein n=1 Tax=Fictibacillus sp. KU28468 TaxID=2991053 RepID=UPI00223CE24D|nr:UDP-glucuronic acid decarboxylase family protein [Fictibacillus sp. KU28468]UZJ77357.1 SDR family oxidoreductase [Fictibacillus sp. KU28468]
MKKIIITGVAGFLGYQLAETLLSEGCCIIGIDNLSTGRVQNIVKLNANPNFTFIKLDVCSDNLFPLKEITDIDQIYHLASPASPKYYQHYPFETIEINTIGTKNMLELTKTHNAKMVYLSTSEVYGDPEIHPQTEDYRGNVNTWGPRACYDEGKRLGEVFCYLYHSLFGVKIKVARIFNTYSAGLRNDDGRVISNFVNQAIKGEEITVYGDGSQSRSFCYVDDTIRAIMLMMKNDAANGEIINIGNPNEITVLNLAKLIKELTNSSSDIVFLPLPKDDPKQRRPNIDKAKKILDWEPKVSLEEGLQRTINVYKSSFSN